MTSERSVRRRRGNPRGAMIVTLALAACFITNCTVNEDIVARRLHAGSSGAGPGAGAPSSQAGGEGSCQDVVFVSTATSSGEARDTCVGWAARRTFTHALCSCGDVGVASTLVSRATDSSPHPVDGPAGSAAVGINGSYRQAESLSTDGSLTIAGEAGLSPNVGVDVAGDLRLAGPAAAAGPILVGRDAWVLAATSSLSLIQVERDLYVGPDATVTSFGPVLVGGKRFERPFAVAPPCACADSDLLDVHGIVQDGMLRNDNARIGLAVDALDAPSAPVSLSLECGRFALRRIADASPIALHIDGKVALFVDGNVELGPTFTLELGPGAELDWFVRGTVSLAPGSKIGKPARAGAARLYTIEPGELTLPGTVEVALDVYAPRTDVTIGGLGDVYGALFAASVSTPATLLIHYDRSVMGADADCSLPAPTTCSRCDDCPAGATCMLGTCGACSVDADCCFPLVCDRGECRTLGVH